MTDPQRRVPRWLEAVGLVVLMVVVAIGAAVAMAALISLVS